MGLFPLNVCFPLSPHWDPCPRGRERQSRLGVGAWVKSQFVLTEDRDLSCLRCSVHCECQQLFPSLCSDAALGPNPLSPSEPIPPHTLATLALLWSCTAGQVGGAHVASQCVSGHELWWCNCRRRTGLLLMCPLLPTQAPPWDWVTSSLVGSPQIQYCTVAGLEGLLCSGWDMH